VAADDIPSVYLQTDTLYLNTVVHASITNFGLKVKFVNDG
jgi:hypothetical protein